MHDVSYSGVVEEERQEFCALADYIIGNSTGMPKGEQVTSYLNNKIDLTYASLLTLRKFNFKENFVPEIIENAIYHIDDASFIVKVFDGRKDYHTPRTPLLHDKDGNYFLQDGTNGLLIPAGNLFNQL